MRFDIPKQLVARTRKGSVIPVKDINGYLPEWKDEEEHRLLVLGFKACLEKSLRKAGRPCTLRIRENGRAIHALTDEESADFNDRSFQGGIGKMTRAHRRKQEVDHANLSDETRQKHFDQIVVNSRVLMAAVTARRDPEFVPMVRNVPAIGQAYGLDLEADHA